MADDVFEVEVEAAVHVGEALGLLLVEVLQLVPRHHPVPVQVHDPEPVLDALLGRLILHADDEPHEVPEPHLLRLQEPLDGLGEDPFDGFAGEGVAGVLGELFLGEEEVVVGVELPEAEVDDVEVLVAEEVCVLVDVGLGLDVDEALEDARLLELSRSRSAVPEGHLVVILPVRHVVHPVDHAQRVPVLELRLLLQELQPRVRPQHLPEQRLEVLDRHVLLRLVGAQQPVRPVLQALRLELLPHPSELRPGELPLRGEAGAPRHHQDGEVDRQLQHARGQLLHHLIADLRLLPHYRRERSLVLELQGSVEGLPVGEVELGDLGVLRLVAEVLRQDLRLDQGLPQGDGLGGEFFFELLVGVEGSPGGSDGVAEANAGPVEVGVVGDFVVQEEGVGLSR